MLVFPYQTWWRHFDGNLHNGGVECKGGMKNEDFRPLFSPISHSISETVTVRWAHAARQFVSIEFSFHHTTYSVIAPGASQEKNKNVVKKRFLDLRRLTHWLKHRITGKLLKIDGYMLRGVWQTLNCLSIRATYCVIIAGASPGETKMWAAVRENADFLHLLFE